MRRWGQVGLVLLGVACVAPVPSGADVVAPYDRTTTTLVHSMACAATEGDGINVPYHSMCVEVADHDGDGAADEAWVSWSLWWPDWTSQSGTGAVPIDAVTVDFDAGTAAVDAVVDGCHVEAAFTSTAPIEHRPPGAVLDVWSPGVVADGYELTLGHRAHETHHASRTADAGGSLCGRWAGSFHRASLEEWRTTRRDVGVSVDPGGTPVAPGAVEHRRTHVADRGRRTMCAAWWEHSEWSTEHVSLCVVAHDDDGDGALDRATATAERTTCADVCWSHASVESPVDPSAVEVAPDASGARVHGWAGACRLDVDLAVTATSRWRGSTSGTAAPADDDGGVRTGTRHDRTVHRGEAVPTPGSVVCGWALVDTASHADAWVETVEERQHDATLHVHPERAAP